MLAVSKRQDFTVVEGGRDQKPGAPDWRDTLRKVRDGYAGDERNVALALRSAPELQHLVRFNEFSLQVEFQVLGPPWREAGAGAPWVESDDTELMMWLQERGINVTRPSVVAAVVQVVARDLCWHPVRSYLRSLQWDREPRLEVWLKSYLGAVGAANYLAAVGRRFLISAVARILRPGCQVDHTLVLEADQGAGKTSAVRTLAVQPAWCAGDLPDIHSKDARLQLAGRWIIEIAELKAVRSSQLEAVKSFLTQTHDTFRPPYGRRTAQFPRQCVFLATTNEAEYLRDRTGNRRYWPVRCGDIDLQALERDRDQLWAEAVHEFNTGAAWHLTAEEMGLAQDEQAERVFQTEIEAEVGVYLRSLRDADTFETSVKDVLVHGLRLDPDKPDYVTAARRLGSEVAEALRLAGWMKDRRTRGDDGRRTVYRFSGQGGQDI